MRLVEECQQALSAILPLSDNAITFLDLLLDHGEIDATMLTSDPDLQKRIQKQPLLEWKAVNVRKYKESTPSGGGIVFTPIRGKFASCPNAAYIALKPNPFKPEEWRVASKGWIWELHTVCSQMVQLSHHHTEPHRL